ncbi:hypothetical protein SRHO_G00101230 [Serrasalmus rhombeus]
MTAQRERADALRINVEAEDSEYAGAPWLGTNSDRASEHVARLRLTAKKLAADAGFGSLREEDRACAKTRARAVGWSEDMKALQLALCLTDEALTCLLLLSPAERGDYGALVGALEQRFGQCNQPGVLRSELASRQRLSGEPLRALANDIETLTRRAYSHMTPDVQSELARDQFIRTITPSELRMQTQLAHPCTLQEALELALEREAVGAAAESYHVGAAPAVRAVAQVRPGQEKPEWAAELTELIRAMSLQSPCGGVRPRPRRGPPGCWVCGQVGHISARCPRQVRSQGNDSGSV